MILFTNSVGKAALINSDHIVSIIEEKELPGTICWFVATTDDDVKRLFAKRSEILRSFEDDIHYDKDLLPMTEETLRVLGIEKHMKDVAASEVESWDTTDDEKEENLEPNN